MNTQQRSFPWLGITRGCTLSALVTVGLLAPLCAQTPDTLNPGADTFVYATAIQTDGRIVVGGSFTTLGGQPRSCIGRLNADGTLDTAFNPGATGLPDPNAVPTSVHCLAVQADGKIVVGGYFTTLGGQPRMCIGRLNPDGTADPAFNPGIDGANHYCFLWSLAVQADGKILVGGYFTQLAGQPRSNIGRLNPDGTLDTGFNPGADYEVDCLAIQPDGKILVAGVFSRLAGQGCNYFGRLNLDGTPDTGFGAGANGYVRCAVCQPDGKILAAGNFTTLGGQTRKYIARLNSNGTADLGFNAVASSGASSLALQADGRIVVGGHFSTLGGQPRSDLGRLMADGTLDPSLNQGASGTTWPSVFSVAVQSDGKILVGGYFATLAGEARSCIGRLNSTDPATESLTCDATTITWLRGGASPEITRSSFDASTDGTNWVNLGAGTRISGGWQLSGIAVPTNALVRALGYVTGGFYSGSGWMVQTLLAAPRVFSQPVSQTNSPGSVAAFSVVAGGVAPLSYQWLKDGITLGEGGNVSGVQTPTLTLSNLAGADEGGYSVIISNSFGSVTSLVATLTVLDPFIAGSPTNQNVNAGDDVTLSVTALGTAPMGYQWRKDGAAKPGATSASLTLTNVQGADAGFYDVVVTNGFGSLTSAVALLTVNLASADVFNPNAAGTVYTTAIQGDGKILVGGAFVSLGGQARSNLGRLDAGGTVDTTFSADANGTVDTLAVQADGKILVGGSFNKLGGQTHQSIGRLNSDGTVDTNFNSGANWTVYCVVPQTDGKILVGGAFTALAGPGTTNVGRLNPNGTQDTTFHANANDVVYSLAVQGDGMILIGGAFTTLNGQPRRRLARLYPDGSLDSAFDPGAGGTVSGLAVQADGKLLVGGYFLSLGGQPRNYIGRLNPDGSLDTAFNPGANDYVFSLAVQADGKIQVGGNFTTLAGLARNRLGRLNSDGTPDLTFNPAANACVYSLALQADGTTLVGGSFTALGGQARRGLGRLTGTDTPTQALTVEAAQVTWLRSGSTPEVSCASVEVSTNGSDWTVPSAGARIAGGWRFTGVAVPTNATIRARGLATGGQYNRSSWVVETQLAVASQPPCRFTSVCYGPGGGAKLQFSAPTGATYAIEASADLVSWQEIGQAQVQADGTFAFEDPDAVNYRGRYYRVSQVAGP